MNPIRRWWRLFQLNRRLCGYALGEEPRVHDEEYSFTICNMVLEKKFLVIKGYRGMWLDECDPDTLCYLIENEKNIGEALRNEAIRLKEKRQTLKDKQNKCLEKIEDDGKG